MSGKLKHNANPYSYKKSPFSKMKALAGEGEDRPQTDTCAHVPTPLHNEVYKNIQLSFHIHI